MRSLRLLTGLSTVLVATSYSIAQTHVATTSPTAGAEESTASTVFVPNAERPAIYDGPYPSIDHQLQDRLAYPFWARASAVTGTITVAFTIDGRGRVRNAAVLKGPDFGLHHAILTALKEVRFRPAMQGSRARPVGATLKIRIAPRD